MLKYSHKQPFSFICYIVELIVEKLKFLHIARFVSVYMRTLYNMYALFDFIFSIL